MHLQTSSCGNRLSQFDSVRCFKNISPILNCKIVHWLIERERDVVHVVVLCYSWNNFIYVRTIPIDAINEITWDCELRCFTSSSQVSVKSITVTRTEWSINKTALDDGVFRHTMNFKGKITTCCLRARTMFVQAKTFLSRVDFDMFHFTWTKLIAASRCRVIIATIGMIFGDGLAIKNVSDDKSNKSKIIN